MVVNGKKLNNFEGTRKMKKTIVLIVVLILAGIVLAGYDYADRPDSAKDCIDALIPIPTPTAKQFGNTDKVRLVYNIAELLKAVSAQQEQIKALEATVAELEIKVAELSLTPSDVIYTPYSMDTETVQE